jgi:ABC-2 type transport system permease protein
MAPDVYGRREYHVFLSAVVTAGTERAVIQFFDHGAALEYEMVRELSRLGSFPRKRLGVLETGAGLYGGFDANTFQPKPRAALLAELESQYDVTPITLNDEIIGRYDALLVVQPSLLSQEDVGRLVDLISSGVPTAVFEDPFPAFFPGIPGSAPSASSSRGVFAPPAAKADLTPLWDMLGVDFSAQQLVWQGFRPDPIWTEVSPEIVFLNRLAGGRQPVFNTRVAEGLERQGLILAYAGHVAARDADDTRFRWLLRTGSEGGTVDADDILSQGFGSSAPQLNPDRPHRKTGKSYVLAAQIEGAMPAEGDRPAIRVIVVADMDLLADVFFQARRTIQGDRSDAFLEHDNPAFLLNALDVLVGDDRFLDLRGRSLVERNQVDVENRVRAARRAAQVSEEYEQQLQVERDRMASRLREIEDDSTLDERARAEALEREQEALKRQLEVVTERLRRQREREFDAIQRELGPSRAAIRHDVDARLVERLAAEAAEAIDREPWSP